VQNRPRSARPLAPGLGAEPFPVTERQAQILELAARGLSDKQIAQRLGVTHRTVRSHLERLYNSSGVRGRVAVVVAWVLSSERARRARLRAEGGDLADPPPDG
jgi:DNA-binding NarL/FixJ family response regulator